MVALCEKIVTCCAVESDACLKMLDPGEITGLQRAALVLWLSEGQCFFILVGESVFMPQSSHDPANIDVKSSHLFSSALIIFYKKW